MKGNYLSDYVKHISVLVLAVLSIGFIYSPGINGPFVFDDYPNIVFNEGIKIDSISLESLQNVGNSGMTGGGGRPLSVISFALNYYWGDGGARSFKIVNIIIHCASFLALIFFTYQLLMFFEANNIDRSALFKIGFIIALIWSVHPLNLTSVLYVVQRMASLSVLFTFLSLGFYCKARTSSESLYFILTLVFFTLGALSKENSLMVPFYIGLLELALVLRCGKVTTYQLQLLIVVFCLGVTLSIFMIVSSGQYLSYSSRDFSMLERLYTELRVVLDYLKLSLLPNIQQMTLFHDDIVVSKSLYSPPITLIAFGVHCLLLCSAIILRKRNALYTFSIFFFYFGHVMESTILPLELMHEHRNYLSLSAVVIACYSLLKDKCFKKTTTLIVVFVVVLLSVLTFIRSQTWSSYGQLTTTMADRQPLSVRAQSAAGRFYYVKAEKAKNQEQLDYFLTKADQHFMNVVYGNGTSIMGHVGIIFLYELNNKKVSERLLIDLQERLSGSSLLNQDLRAFIELVKCYADMRCLIHRKTMETLAKGLVTRKLLNGSPFEELLNHLIVIYINNGAYSDALNLVRDLRVERGGREIFDSLETIILQKKVNKIEY